MKTDGKGYVEGMDLTVPVFRKPMGVPRYIDLLYEALEKRYPESERNKKSNRNNYTDRKRIIRQIEAYLASKGITKISPDEALLDGFVDHLMATGNGTTTRRRTTDSANRIRNLTNDLPKKLLQRRLLSARELKRATRFDHLESETKNLLIEFLKNGKRIKKSPTGSLEPTSTRYAEGNRQNTVDDAVQFLRTIGKTDFLTVTKDDTTRYLQMAEARGKENRAHSQLVEIRKLFMLLQMQGKITENPLEYFRRKRIGVNDDFVPPESMAILQDLDTVDLDDVYHVQARLLCFSLCYDFALRRTEACGLALDDVAIDKFVELRLRPENQKGDRNGLVVLYSCFPETMTLMKRFLELRKKMNPSTDSLLVNQRGTPLQENTCCKLVKDHCAKLGVRTYQGNVATAHRFRHSFGTLNTESLGLKLSPQQVQRRLRHYSLDFTVKVYITNNPYLEKMRHEAQFGENHGVEDESTLKLEGRMISEREALKRLKPFGITLKAMRGFGEQKGILQTKDGTNTYSETAIDDLLQHYETKETAMSMLGLGKSGFWDWYTRNALEPLNIGKVSLWRREDVLEGRRRLAG